MIYLYPKITIADIVKSSASWLTRTSFKVNVVD